MALTFTAVTDLRYSTADNAHIDAQVTFDGIGTIPFTCCADDYEAHTIEIYTRALAGDFGPIAPYTAPEATAEDGRAWRDAELNANQWLVDRHRDQVADGVATTLTTEQYKALQDYRQALRDWPASTGFPAESSRPAAPDWLAPAESA